MWLVVIATIDCPSGIVDRPIVTNDLEWLYFEKFRNALASRSTIRDLQSSKVCLLSVQGRPYIFTVVMVTVDHRPSGSRLAVLFQDGQFLSCCLQAFSTCFRPSFTVLSPFRVLSPKLAPFLSVACLVLMPMKRKASKSSEASVKPLPHSDRMFQCQMLSSSLRRFHPYSGLSWPFYQVNSRRSILLHSA